MPKTSCDEEEEDPQIDLSWPWVWGASDFIFVASAYGGGQPVLSLAISHGELMLFHSAVLMYKTRQIDKKGV